MLDNILDVVLSFSGTFFTVITLIAIYWLTKSVLDRQAKGKSDWGIIRTIVLFSIALTGIIAIILSLPMSESLRGQITSLIGIVISAVLALSSATFIGNGLAGVMLRTINSFKPGDFIAVNEHFGRITERGLFHTEIQTETRDLTTLPNLYLATNPVKVTRLSGTFIKGVCSLGYDVNRQKVEKALLDAAERAGLKDAFVRITELGDFSIVYTIAGLEENVKTILSSQSRLNAMMLDALHDADIEIVSPNFMNQRQVGETVFIPTKPQRHEEVVQTDAPEDKIFDKAEEAQVIEERKNSLSEVEAQIKQCNEDLKNATDESEKEALTIQLEGYKEIKEKLTEEIDTEVIELDSKK